ncbi:MAG TPA: hypothetical protein VLV47_01190 [Candidatus Bathyarchaeia archaeon]|nr:hypothetical protein [Candidatus Bathyarchaeia archaeon]
MKQLFLIALLGCIFFALPARAQFSEQPQVDVGFGVSTVTAPSSFSATGNHSPQTIGGGAYLDFSGDVLFWHHLGAGAEVAWRASQNLYGGYQPFRPIFYDFNGVYAPPLGKYAQLQLVGGIGALSTRFYTQNYTCDYFYYYCTNYYSSNHFMGDVGAGVQVYVYHSFFLRPEFREYFIHNNYEFSSGHATRAGVTLGYSFGRPH